MVIVGRVAWKRHDDIGQPYWTYSVPIEFVNMNHFKEWKRAWYRKFRAVGLNPSKDIKIETLGGTWNIKQSNEMLEKYINNIDNGKEGLRDD